MARKNIHRFQGQEGEQRHAGVDAALDFLVRNYEKRPSLEDVASIAKLSPYHFQRTFQSWMGITPKQFIQYLQLGKAKELLIAEHSLMATAFEIGLSGPSRLHDLFVSCEAVTPGEFKLRGAGMIIYYGFHRSPFGRALVAATERGICWLGFSGPRGDPFIVRELENDWPGAVLIPDADKTEPLAESAFARGLRREKSAPLAIHIRGTNFQVKVWEALLAIPFGRLATYQDVAAVLGMPSAARAVGQAVGANPISLVIPCHRVILKSGLIHNYRWGSERKRSILAIEQSRTTTQRV